MTTTRSPERSISQTTRRARIIVIEDDSVLTEVIRELLEDEGLAVSVCKRWEYAHACVVVYQPDLVFLDLRFGDEEYGWRILDQLILDPATRGIPVIVSSAAVDSLRTPAPALLAQNGLFVLPRPFDLGRLLGTIDTALEETPHTSRSATRPTV